MTLKEILSIQTESYNCWRMFAYIIRKANKYGWDYKVDDLGNIYITKGESDIYPCMVAHMDTVHYIVEDLSVVEVQGAYTGFNAYTMTQTGIGGDDKVGIWIALNFLDAFEYGKAVFFVDEEVGCQGSYYANMDFFDDCSLVLQCDRKGNSDFITQASEVELSSKEFQYAISGILDKYGYSFGKGLMTDVMALKEMGLECCAANISCGYYNPHCENEYVDIEDANKCMNLCFDIIESVGGVFWDHRVIKKKKGKDRSSEDFSTGYGTYLDHYYKQRGKSKKSLESCDFIEDIDAREEASVDEEFLAHMNYGICDMCCGEDIEVEYVRTWDCFLCEDCMEEVREGHV